MATSNEILQSYLNTFEKAEDKLRYKHMVLALIQATEITALSPLNYYLHVLSEIDEVQIARLTVEQNLMLKRKLHITYLLLLQEQSKTGKQNNQLIRCASLLDTLSFHGEGTGTIEFLESSYAYDGKPAGYTGLIAGKWLAERIIEVIDNTVKPIIEWMTAINDKRLYWVWGGGLLRTVLSLLPEDFYNTKNASNVAGAPSRYTGYMSWTLYFARFALNSILLIKDTFHPDLTDEEKKRGNLAYWDRFKTQWNIRKFTLLNDSIWGIANMVCFFWLHGSGGDALTLALLVFDLFIALWDFEENKTKYNKKIDAYIKDIKQLKSELDTAIQNSDKNTESQIRLKIKALEKEKVTCQRNWEHTKIGLISSVAYALGLIISFAILTTPFMPIPAATLIIVGVVGAVLCFALTVISNAIRSGLEIRGASLSAKEAKNEFIDKIDDFKRLIANNPSLDDKEKILLFMEIKQLMAQTEHQKQMVIYHSMHLVRSIIMQSLIPALMFVSLVFLPLGIGFAVLGAAIVVALVSNLIIEKRFKPKDVEFSEFDNKEFNTFCKSIADSENKNLEPSQYRQTFFTSNKSTSDRVKAAQTNDELDGLLNDNSNPSSC